MTEHIEAFSEELRFDSIEALVKRLQEIRAEHPSAALDWDYDGPRAVVYRDATPEELAQEQKRREDLAQWAIDNPHIVMHTQALTSPIVATSTEPDSADT
jgi:hypothetical protein